MNTFYSYRVRVLHWCTDQAMTAALAQMDLTSAQGQIMGFIDRSEQPPCSHDIERALQLRHSTVSGLLSRLERKGFLTLDTDGTDRRCKRIRLLPKGQACLCRIHAQIESIEERMVTGFTPEERAQFLGFLYRAIENVGAPCRQLSKEEQTQC